jgi:GNAT superfamily N-acetyltransferase
MRAGMALAAAPGSDLATLERYHRDATVAPNRVVLVAERDGEIVGMAALGRSTVANAAHRAEVQRVAVAAAAQGEGVGRLLMAAIEDAARERGITLLWLTTHADSEACAFYERLGYTQLGVMPDYSRRPDGELWPGAFYYRRLSK